MRTKELEKFGQLIQKEINAYKKEGDTEENRRFVTGIKDAVYLLGVAINEKEYSWANGFEKFCKRLNINFDLRD